LPKSRRRGIPKHHLLGPHTRTRRCRSCSCRFTAQPLAFLHVASRTRRQPSRGNSRSGVGVSLKDVFRCCEVIVQHVADDGVALSAASPPMRLLLGANHLQIKETRAQTRKSLHAPFVGDPTEQSVEVYVHPMLQCSYVSNYGLA